MLSCVQPNLATMQRHYPPKHLFSHCHQIYCHSQDDDESLSEKQIDIESFSLDEIKEAVASLVVFIKIYPVVLNHGIAHDYGEQQKTQCHYKNSLFLFRESLNYIFHGAKIVFFFQKRCRIPMFRCRIPMKKVSHSYECDTLFNVFFHFAMRFPGIYRKMVSPAFYPLRLHFQPFSPAIRQEYSLPLT